MNSSFLHPEFEKKLNELVELCKKHNMTCTITNTYRTESEQNELYSQGRLAPGTIVTCGQYPNNYHCWGLAADVEIVPKFYDVFKELVESIGLSWGGEDREFINVNHV